jgi:hypothetical protein
LYFYLFKSDIIIFIEKNRCLIFACDFWLFVENIYHLDIWWHFFRSHLVSKSKHIVFWSFFVDATLSHKCLDAFFTILLRLSSGLKVVQFTGNSPSKLRKRNWKCLCRVHLFLIHNLIIFSKLNDFVKLHMSGLRAEFDYF